MEDARFEDTAFTDQPLRLAIASAEDVEPASALLQDAVGHNGDISWMPRRRRLAILLNRFRWEDSARATAEGRAYERVRSILMLDSVMRVRSRGIEPKERQSIFSLLALRWQPRGEGTGSLILTLARSGAGGAELAADVECLDGRIIDLTRPWEAPTGKAPDHGD